MFDAAAASLKSRDRVPRLIVSMHTDGMLGLHVSNLDGHPSVLAVDGELDLTSAPSLKWALTDLLDAGATELVVDLSRVSFIDSTALGVLVGIQMGLSADARLAIACGDANVLKIFELTGLDGTFDIFATLDDALAHVRGTPAAG